MSKEITLDEFIVEAHIIVDSFKEYYERNHKEDPNNWPLSLEHGLWYEFLDMVDWVDLNSFQGADCQ